MTTVKGLITLFTIVLSFTVMSQWNCTPTNITPEFGANRWIVRVYDAKYLHNISNDTYRGYYTQKLDNTNNYGVNTTLQWEATGSGRPSQAVAFSDEDGTGTRYYGCALYNQDFSFVHKRRGFPEGQYEIFVDRWDDKTEVYLDGQLIVELADYGSNTHAPKCITLNANSRLEIRTDNRGASMSELKVRIVRTNISLSITPNPANICKSEDATLTVTAVQNSSISNANPITNELTNLIWSGGAISSGQGTNTVTVSPSSNTLYTYTAVFKYCSVTASTLVNVQQPPGDPEVFGDNTWNVYGYEEGSTTATVNNLNYYGYYTQTLDHTSDFGFNTADLQNGGWNIGSSPSTSTIWNGCEIRDNDSYTYVHKRRGFPCASYRVTMDKWDSNTRLFINGVQIQSLSGNCVTQDCQSQFIGIYELDANSTIEVRTNEAGGDSWTKMKIVPVITSNLANHNDVKTCAVKGNQWVHYHSHPEGRYLASVRGTTPTSDLGNVTVRTYVDAQNQMSYACDNVDHITAVMQRHWLIDAVNNGAAEVRLPYKDQEFVQIDEASIVSINPDDRVYYPNQSTVKLSKYDGPNENGNVNDNCYGNSVMYESHNNGFNTASYHYRDFIIPGFSEFWLHGADYITALPNVLNDFQVDCKDNGQSFEIQALIENKTDFIRVDFSENGLQWNEIFKQKTEPKPLEYQTFKGFHQNNRQGYFRVSTLDKSGQVNTLHVLHQKCETSANNMSIFPNPANDLAVLQFNYTNSTSTDLDIQIYSVTGQMVDQIKTSVNGTNINIQLKVDQYQKGTYLIYVSDGENNRWIPQQLVIQ